MDKIGILDPEGKYKNPLTGNNYSNEYTKYSLGDRGWSKYPVYKDALKIIDLIINNQILLVISGTGSGKSVLIPKLALHTLKYDGKVVMTNPKIYSTISGAEFAAKTLDVKLGDEVGYQFRGSKLSNGGKSKSDKTKLLLSTDGSIVSQLINDPSLKSYDIVIIDEAHERSIQIDLLLLLMKKALKLNPKLKLIIMSATINAEIFKNYYIKDFKYSQIEVSSGPNYPVEVKYLKHSLKNPEKDFIDVGIDQIIDILKKTKDGDILMFVNSFDEASKVCKKLKNKIEEINLEKVFCIEISASSDQEIKNYVKNPLKYKNRLNGPFSRRVIIGTNTIESSATIDGLNYVIDSGWAYNDSFDPITMQKKLLQTRISQAQADQRKGRVGRTSSGICYRLYTEKEFKEFIKYPITDIQKSDLTDDMLRFMTMPYVNNINELLKLLNELIEPPKKEFIKCALYKLYALDMITGMNKDSILTDIGKEIVKFKKLNPMLAKFIINCYKNNIHNEGIILSSLLLNADSRMNVFIIDLPNKDKNNKQKIKDRKNKLNKFINLNGDMSTLLNIYYKYKEYANEHNRDELRKWCLNNYLKFQSFDNIDYTIKQIYNEVREILYDKKKIDIEEIYETDGILLNKIPNNKLLILSGGIKIEKYNENKKLFDILLDSFFINIAIKNKNKYTNMFPFKKLSGDFSNNSICDNKSKYIVYYEFSNILGRLKFNIINKISENQIKNLSNKQKKMLDL